MIFTIELLECIEALEVEVVLVKERVAARSIEQYRERNVKMIDLPRESFFTDIELNGFSET